MTLLPEQHEQVKCELCEKMWTPDYYQFGYQWTCDTCKHPNKECKCGSDDVTLDWDIVTDPNGELCPNPAWSVTCHMCECQTTYFLTAKEANDAWMNEQVFMPIEGTDHFEEAW